MLIQSQFGITFDGEEIIRRGGWFDGETLEFPTDHPGEASHILNSAAPHLASYGNASSELSFTTVRTLRTPSSLQAAWLETLLLWREKGKGKLTLELSGDDISFEALLTHNNPRMIVEGSRNRLYHDFSFTIGKKL